MKIIGLRILIPVILCLFSLKTLAQSAQSVFATEADFKDEIALVNCKNDERLIAVRKLFGKLGTGENDMTIEKIGKVENLVVTLKGKSHETVVVGAHYDKTDEGCGALDNWTGIMILAHLYKTMKSFSTEKTYVFAAFGKEELGLIGSRAMAERIPKEKRTDYCAMVNFDSFGMAYPQALRNISDQPLIDVAKDVSLEMKLPFADASISSASSDSQSFRTVKIPAITLHGLGNNWAGYLHSSGDKVSNVNTQSVYVGYRHGLAFLSKIDRQPCGAFRK